ncbi:MAG: toll/interleukin-1 receptor domain-containing protein [Planctomycetes bacterium]|nr:toll/interleukin-1 receptor domain-containing protein [Planctomycetota bacterium]
MTSARPRRRARPSRVFVSHAHQDSAIAREIVKWVRARRVKVWFAPAHIETGAEWYREIGRGLDSCDWFLVLVSRSAARSLWVRREVESAAITDRFENRIIPILLDSTRPKALGWSLAAMQYIDLRGGSMVPLGALAKRWSLPAARKKAGQKRA